MGSNFANLFNLVAGMCSILGLVFTARPLLNNVEEYVRTLAPLPKPERLEVLLHLSILILIAHGVLWIVLDRWKYGTGVRKNAAGHVVAKTPTGIAAAVLSLSVTVPAVTVPLLYQVATAKRLAAC